MKQIKNMNQLAVEVAKREKGKKQVNIAQIKEILRVIEEINAEFVIKHCLLNAYIVHYRQFDPITVCGLLEYRSAKLALKKLKAKGKKK